MRLDVYEYRYGQLSYLPSLLGQEYHSGRSPEENKQFKFLTFFNLNSHNYSGTNECKTIFFK